MAYGQPPQQPYPPRPPYGPPPRRKGMPPALLAGLIAAPIILIVIAIGTLIPDDKPAPTIAARPTPTEAPVTARSITDGLARRHSLPHPRDNTHACEPWCRQLITTDTVSVYELPDEAGAKRMVAGVTPAYVRRVGRFVLSFVGQRTTPKATRDEMAVEAEGLVG